MHVTKFEASNALTQDTYTEQYTEWSTCPAQIKEVYVSHATADTRNICPQASQISVLKRQAFISLNIILSTVFFSRCLLFNWLFLGVSDVRTEPLCRV